MIPVKAELTLTLTATCPSCAQKTELFDAKEHLKSLGNIHLSRITPETCKKCGHLFLIEIVCN
jgi:C4-type Zn-finger protein